LGGFLLLWYFFYMSTIVQNGDARLRLVSQEISSPEFGTPYLEDVIQRMKDSLAGEQDGVALAAPQLGISKRIFIVRFDRLTPLEPEEAERASDVGIFINPSFVRTSRRRQGMDEGCLSVRGIYGKTYRHVRATVEAQTMEGTFFERGGGGLLAQIFQHEIDHLDGILFIDHAEDLVQIERKIPAQDTTVDHE